MLAAQSFSPARDSQSEASWSFPNTLLWFTARTSSEMRSLSLAFSSALGTCCYLAVNIQASLVLLFDNIR